MFTVSTVTSRPRAGRHQPGRHEAVHDNLTFAGLRRSGGAEPGGRLRRRTSRPAARGSTRCPAPGSRTWSSQIYRTRFRNHVLDRRWSRRPAGGARPRRRRDGLLQLDELEVEVDLRRGTPTGPPAAGASTTAPSGRRRPAAVAALGDVVCAHWGTYVDPASARRARAAHSTWVDRARDGPRAGAALWRHCNGTCRRWRSGPGRSCSTRTSAGTLHQHLPADPIGRGRCATTPASTAGSRCAENVHGLRCLVSSLDHRGHRNAGRGRAGAWAMPRWCLWRSGRCPAGRRWAAVVPRRAGRPGPGVRLARRGAWPGTLRGELGLAEK